MLNRFVLMIIAASLISGCGFKLRGDFTMPESLSTVSIEGGNLQLNEQLKAYLERSGSNVVDNRDESTTIVLTRTEFDRKVGTTNADGLATGYNYEYIVDFEVNDAEGTNLLPSSTLNQFRSLSYEAGDELAVEREEEFLREEMEKDISLQIMRRLARL